jgi:hypothetical protein
MTTDTDLANAQAMPEPGTASGSSKKAKRTTLKEWANLDFKPIDTETLEDIKPVSNEHWAKIGKDVLPCARIAWILLCKSKAELKEIVAGLGLEDDGPGCEMVEGLENAGAFFNGYAEMITAAKIRLLSVASLLELEASKS